MCEPQAKYQLIEELERTKRENGLKTTVHGLNEAAPGPSTRTGQRQHMSIT